MLQDKVQQAKNATQGISSRQEGCAILDIGLHDPYLRLHKKGGSSSSKAASTCLLLVLLCHALGITDQEYSSADFQG